MTAAPLFSCSRVTLERTLIQTLIKSTKTSPHGWLVFLSIPDYMFFSPEHLSLSQHCNPKSTHCSLDQLFCTSTFLPPVLAKRLLNLVMSVITQVKKRHLSFNINALTSMSFAPKALWIILVPNPLGTVSNVTAHMPFLPGYSVSLSFYCKILDTENVSWRTVKNFSLWKHCCSFNLSYPLICSFPLSIYIEWIKMPITSYFGGDKFKLYFNVYLICNRGLILF